MRPNRARVLCMLDFDWDRLQSEGADFSQAGRRGKKSDQGYKVLHVE